jgi:hypothetical protein
MERLTRQWQQRLRRLMSREADLYEHLRTCLNQSEYVTRSERTRRVIRRLALSLDWDGDAAKRPRDSFRHGLGARVALHSKDDASQLWCGAPAESLHGVKRARCGATSR